MWYLAMGLSEQDIGGNEFLIQDGYNSEVSLYYLPMRTAMK